MQSIITGTKFNANKDILYTKPKLNSVGGKNVGILNAKTKKATYIATPLMLTWGVNEYVDEKNGRRTYDMSLQFPRDDYANDDTRNFLANLVAFEEKLKSDAVKYKKEWLNKSKMSSDVVDALWTPMLRYPKNQDTGEPDTTRAPTLRVKLPYWEGEWKSELYDMNEEQLFPNSEELTPVDLITKGTHLAAVLICGGVWFANGKFGVTWKLFQAVVKPKATLRGKCHIKLTSNEREQLNSKNEEEDDEEEDDVMVSTVVSSDEEDDGEEDDGKTVQEEVQEEVAPKFTTPKKKVVKKKKKVVKKKKSTSSE
jgi:hypothetical protein